MTLLPDCNPQDRDRTAPNWRYDFMHYVHRPELFHGTVAHQRSWHFDLFRAKPLPLAKYMTMAVGQHRGNPTLATFSYSACFSPIYSFHYSAVFALLLLHCPFLIAHRFRCKLEELRFGCGRVTQQKHIDVPPSESAVCHFLQQHQKHSQHQQSATVANGTTKLLRAFWTKSI